MAPLIVILAPGTVGNIANIVKGYALAFGVAFAVWFGGQWWRSRLRERAQELAGRARSVQADLLRLAVANPELAEPMLGGLTGPMEIARYKSFVAALLNGADQILLLDDSSQWPDVLARQLAPHRSYLASEEFRALSGTQCSPALRAVIDRVVSG